MKSILIIGVGNFGMLIAKRVHELGHQVMAIDINEKRINDVLPYVTNALIGDSTSESFMSSLGVNNFDVCIETIGNDFQSSLETTALLKELGGKKVVSRANREVQEKFLLRNGADEVVNPEKIVAEWAAVRYTSNHILDYIKIDENHVILELRVPNEWVGRSVRDINVRKKYGINIVAIKEEGNMELTVLPDELLKENQTLLVIGERKVVQKFFKI